MQSLFNYKPHLKLSLQYFWMLKDFKIKKAIIKDDKTLEVIFQTKNKFVYFIAGLFQKKGFPISAYSSFRLVFMASIIGAGYVLKKKKLDGAVIVRDFHIEYEKPIMYKSNTNISVIVKTTILKTTDSFHIYETQFVIGKNEGHTGTTKLYYCKPSLKDFSYT